MLTFEEILEAEETEVEEIELDEDAPNAMFDGGDVESVPQPKGKTLSPKPEKVKRSAVESQEPQFILQRRKIDNFNVICRRVLLTPSMCTVNGCSFDIAVKNGFSGWNEVPVEERKMMLVALAEHVKVVHTSSQAHIIKESELPTRWLGDKRQKL
jgi:hypothetical protein